jgi:mono/diheme cytochrome c family protein
VDLSALSASEREAREQAFRAIIAEGKQPMAGFAKRLSAAEQENVLAYIKAAFMKGGQ